MGILQTLKNRKFFKGEGHRLSDGPTRPAPSSPSRQEHTPKQLQFLFRCPAVSDDPATYDQIKAMITEFVSREHEADGFAQKIVHLILERRQCSLFFSTLSTILQNLVREPENDKFRSLKTANKFVRQGIADFPNGFQILEEVGFSLQAETYLLPAPVDVSRISSLLGTLSSLLDLYRPYLDPDIKIYKPAFEISDSTEVAEITAEDVMALQLSRKREVERMETLVSSKFWQKDRPHYMFSRVRMILPDEWRIEASFETCSTVADVFAFLEEHVREECGREFSFSLGNRFVGRDLGEKSIWEVDLGKMAALRVHFGLELLKALGENFHYLKGESVDKFSDS